jgi:phospholipid/cholesterol/gamma-HCH transport system substrate-binding protein
MSDRTERVKAGIFVVITVTLLVMLLVLVAGLRVFKSTKTFHIQFSESITGLEESSTVRYIGVPVGRVSNIGFLQGDSTLIDVAIEVNPDTPIRLKTRAQLKPQGITGISYIDLYDVVIQTEAPVRRDENDLLVEGAVILTQQSITKDLLDTLGELKKLLANMNSVVEENQDAIAMAVKSIQQAAEAASESVSQLPAFLESANELTVDVKTDLSTALASAGRSLTAIEAFATDPEIRAIPGKVGGVLDRADSVLVSAENAVSGVDLQKVLDRLVGALDQLDKTTEEITGAVIDVRGGVLRNTGALARIMSDLRVFSRTLRQLSQEVREQPSRLLFPRNREDRKEEE